MDRDTRRVVLTGDPITRLHREIVGDAARVQIVRSPSTGLTRRTFVAKEWGVIVQNDEAAPAELLIFPTEAQAQAVCRSMGVSRNPPPPEVHYVERLEVVA